MRMMSRVVKLKKGVRVTPNRVDDNTIIVFSPFFGFKKRFVILVYKSQQRKKELSRINIVKRTCWLGNSISEEQIIIQTNPERL